MSRTIYTTVGPVAAAVANSIALSQSRASAGALSLNGSTGGVLDKTRRIAITSVGNDSGITFTIVGSNWNGQPATEVLAGGNAAAVQSVLDYSVVKSITTSAATASTVTVGTAAGAAGGPPLASSPWIRLDEYGPGPVVIDCQVFGTVNFTVESSQDDPNSLFTVVPPSSMSWESSLFPPALSSATATATQQIPASPLWIRCSLNSGTGSVKMAVTQLGPP